MEDTRRTNHVAEGIVRTGREAEIKLEEGDGPQSAHMGDFRWMDRMRHFTFMNYAGNMATGGLTLALRSVPYPFSGQRTIGLVFFFLNIVWFISNTLFITLRFTLSTSPLQRFKEALLHPKEGMFVAAATLAIATLILDITAYGAPGRSWLEKACVVLFCFYIGLSTVVAVGIPMIMFIHHNHTLKTMLPVWILPVLTLMLVGSIGAAVAPLQSPSSALWIVLVSYLCQGLGIMVSKLYLASFILRLIQYGLPRRSETPAMFVAVGPPAFTAYALVKLGQTSLTVFPATGFISTNAGEIFYVSSILLAVLYWGLAWWFAFIGVVVMIRALILGMKFSLSWYAFIFPLVGLVNATFEFGQVFRSDPIKIIGTVMTVSLFGLWFTIVGFHLWAITTRRILWPGRDEDFPYPSDAPSKAKLFEENARVTDGVTAAPLAPAVHL